MKRLTSLTIIAFAAFALVMTSCNSKDEEKRIAELEARLAELESTGSPSTSATPTPVTATPADTKPEGPLPVMEWGDTEWDFGTIGEGDIVEHVYTFKNTGEARF